MWEKLLKRVASETKCVKTLSLKGHIDNDEGCRSFLNYGKLL